MRLLVEKGEGKNYLEIVTLLETVVPFLCGSEADGLRVRQKVGIPQVIQVQVTSWVMGFWKQEETSQESMCLLCWVGRRGRDERLSLSWRLTSCGPLQGPDVVGRGTVVLKCAL